MRLFAYIDPGTGSIILQAIVGVVVGAGYVVRKQIGAVVGGLKRFGKRSESPD